MRIIPRALRPSFIIRSRAIRRGLLGPSFFWKGVAIWVFGKTTIKGFLGKHPDKLGTYKVKRGGFLHVTNAAPLSKKERKRQGRTKDLVIAEAVADVEAARPDKGVRVIK